jgi:hypothetical protein
MGDVRWVWFQAEADSGEAAVPALPDRRRWGGSSHRAPPGRAETRGLGLLRVPAIERKPNVSRAGHSQHVTTGYKKGRWRQREIRASPADSARLSVVGLRMGAGARISRVCAPGAVTVMACPGRLFRVAVPCCVPRLAGVVRCFGGGRRRSGRGRSRTGRRGRSRRCRGAAGRPGRLLPAPACAA